MIARKHGGPGFSLLEIVMAVALFAMVGLGFVLFLRNAVGQSQFSGEHLTALALSQKVLEDVSEEMSINPYGYESLGIDRTSRTPMEAVDGKSVFFSYCEDRSVPWGKIDPQKDGVISSSMSPLYESVKPFRFGVFGDRLLKSGEGENRNILTCNLNFEWKARLGAGRFENACLFFSPVTEKKTNLALAVDEAGIDARIPSEVFHSAGKSLPEIAEATGESVETVTALGRVTLVTQEFMNSPRYREILEKIKTLDAKRAGIPAGAFDDLFACRLEIARSWYESAKNAFQVIGYLEPMLSRLVEGNGLENVGRTGIEPIVIQKALLNYKIIFGTFSGSLLQTRSLHADLLKSDAAVWKGGKAQLQLLQKIFDLYRVTAILPGHPSGMADLKAFLTQVEAFSEGRNPSLNRMIRQESIFLENRNQWMDRYPNLKRLDRILNGKLPPILTFIDRKTRDAVVNR